MNTEKLEEQGTNLEQSSVVLKIQNMEVPMSSSECLKSKIESGEPLDDDDKTRLAREIAELDDSNFYQIVNNAWEKYLSTFPHIKKLTDKIPGIDSYNPLFDPPPHSTLYVIPEYGTVASVSPQEGSLTQALSIEDQRRLMVTQMLTSRYKGLYPKAASREDNADLEYRVWAHEAGHTDLNRTYKQILNAADRIEKKYSPGHFTVGTDCGKYGAITAFQEAIVEMSASEMLGLEVTTLPDVLLSRGNVTVLHELKNTAERLQRESGDTSKPVDSYVWELWYKSELREDVRKMCRAIIEARIQGINPLELGESVNQVILVTLEGNPGMRHNKYTYELITNMVNTAIEVGNVKPSMPPIEITPEKLDVFVNQRETLTNILAREWYNTVEKQ
ncbi:hypothetical protein GYA27_00265 [candidate division WWE3 bacterium]|uniref:Uncharacterized protein n=1 Tax=candidate division WWE3 bacterium TaxID=2053526 RepID=A0A7X9HGI5_UNCKA|nr:hypothetical protein [candidate division WWE3 bacterium]